MSFPFANESQLPNQRRTQSPSINNNITNPDDLIIGLLYDFYFSPGRGHARRLPRGRRTRARAQKRNLSRRTKSRRAMRNFKSHMWAKLLDKTDTQLLVQRVFYDFDENSGQYVETNIDEPEFISKANFYYANLETLNERLEYDEPAMEPYRRLIAMYAVNMQHPHGANIIANAYADYDEM